MTILSAWGSHSGRRASPHLNSNGCRVLCLGLGVGAKKSSDKQLLGPGHGAGRLGSPPDTLEKLGTATASPLPPSLVSVHSHHTGSCHFCPTVINKVICHDHCIALQVYLRYLSLMYQLLISLPRPDWPCSPWLSCAPSGSSSL